MQRKRGKEEERERGREGNNCPRALSLRRYNERHDQVLLHDQVLEEITSFFEENLPPEYNVLADLPRFQPYVFPPSIAATDERPDIVMWSNQTKEVWIVELTVCFDTNCNEAHARKTERYADLMEKIATSPTARKSSYTRDWEPRSVFCPHWSAVVNTDHHSAASDQYSALSDHHPFYQYIQIYCSLSSYARVAIVYLTIFFLHPMGSSHARSRSTQLRAMIESSQNVHEIEL